MRSLSDRLLLFLTRALRLFAHGLLSVVLVLYLKALGLDDARVGLLLTLTLLGDMVVSLLMTTRADRLGRRNMLRLGAVLMILTGAAFALTGDPIALMLVATIGVLSPSGNEVGPFLSIEQAALAQIVADERRVHVFAWYQLTGSAATAFGALAGGLGSQALLDDGFSGPAVYRPVVIAYTVLGGLMLLIFLTLSKQVEAPPRAADNPSRSRLGLDHSQPVVLRLAALFSLDAFGGGFILQSLMAYWFTIRFGVGPGTLGVFFFVANVLAAGSALMASRLAARFGLINTMVFTHLPSNVLLMLVPLMPTLPLAMAVLLLRFCLSQMDVPTRQAYVMSVVRPEERSAAAGVTSVARSIGAAVAPALAGRLLASTALLGLPFFLAGGIKIVYDLLLYRACAGSDLDRPTSPSPPGREPG